jgi:hypothetical protein
MPIIICLLQHIAVQVNVCISTVNRFFLLIDQIVENLSV